jgi:hypothetical protein
VAALAGVASSPSAVFSSSTATSSPAFARWYAVVMLTTPPPRIRVFMAL